MNEIFAISEAGLDYQRMRLETIATNIANMNSVRASVYKPLDVLAGTADIGAVTVPDPRVVERGTADKKVYEPSSPMADANGFVSMPDIDPAQEMSQLLLATRAYEANVRAMTATKAMALKALEIGDKR